MTTDSNATSDRDEARELARRWPWSLAPHEKARLWALAHARVGDMSNARAVVELGKWLRRSPLDALSIAREAHEAAQP